MMELFFWYDYILKKGISRSSITLSFNRSVAREELSKIQRLVNQINHRQLFCYCDILEFILI